MKKSSSYPQRSLIIKGLTSSGKKATTTLSNVNDQADDDKLFELSHKIYALSNNSYSWAIKQDKTTLVMQNKIKPQLWYNGEYDVHTADVTFADIKSATMTQGYYTLPKPLVLWFEKVTANKRSKDLGYAEASSIDLVISNDINDILINLKEYNQDYDRKRDILYRYFYINLAGGGEPTTGTISITTTETTTFNPATPFVITIKE